jgi:hypothetical protein
MADRIQPKIAMFAHSILALCLLLVPVSSIASEALAYVAVYECNADEINQDLVETCSTQFPELSHEANDALSAWRQRNQAKAEAAHRSCERELSEKSKNAPVDDTNKFYAFVTDIKTKIHSNLVADMREKGPAPCIEAFTQLKTPGPQTDIH